MFPTHRPRRLRTTPAMRRLVAETDLRPRQLVLPMFVREGIDEPVPVTSMPGVVQHTRETLRKAATEAVAAGVGGLMLFGVPARRDATGSAGVDPDGILNVALRDVRAEVGDAAVVMADTCLDEFTDHGHCGVLDERGGVDNDATLAVYAEMAVAQADAGAHLLGPSGMMDGQIGVIRAGARRRGPPGHRACSPTPPSTRRRSTGRSARPSTRSCAATARPTSRTRRTSARRCASSRSTSRRAPTSSWSSPR